MKTPNAESDNHVPRLAHSKQAAAELLSVSIATLDRLIKAGKIQKISALRKVLIPDNELKRFTSLNK